jgi:hypothetical protein
MIHFIGFDVETIGDKSEYALQPYRLPRGECAVSSFAVVTEDGLTLDKGLWPTVDQLRRNLEKIAEDPQAVVIGWNTVFDVAWLIGLGLEDVVRRIQWMDGQVLRRGLENDALDYKAGGGWGLKASVAKFLPQYAGYESEVAGNFQKVDATLLEYNREDSWHTAQLGRIMWDAIDPRPATLVQVICQCIPAFACAWMDGVRLSKEALDKWEVKCDEDMEAALHASGLSATVMRSPAQLLKVLKSLGFEVDSTDKSVLSLHQDDPQVAAITKFKRAAGSKSRYIASARKSLEYQGGETIHSAPRMWGTYTGRCTYQSKLKASVLNPKTGKESKKLLPVGIALHQWPKKREGKLARACIVPPKGYLIAEFDFSNQESRVLADITQDRTLLEVFNQGKDFHCIMGSKAARISYEELLAWFETGDKEAERFRQMGKVANLSLAYRTGPQTFQTMARTDYDVPLTFDESTMLCNLFKQTYPRVPAYWSAAISQARRLGYAETKGGRRVYMNWQTTDRKVLYANEQTAINFPVQGTGADMKFLGIALCDAYMQTRGARYIMDLHDALYVVIPDDSRAMDTARGIKKLLNNLPYQDVFGWTPTVPLPVDGKIGTSWGEMNKV